MRIILIGFGTVGRSLARVLDKQRQWLVKTYGFEPQLTTIVDSKGLCRDDKGLDLNIALRAKERYGTVQKYPGKGERNKEVSEAISESDAEVLVEATPSDFKDGQPGMSNIRQALSTSKHVITVDKGPLALAMPALLELAAHKKQRLLFSGTVGAGTPFLNFASKCLPGDRILGMHGILNGTTNYILTRMQENGISFQKALTAARNKGYAEKDSTNDVEGRDTAAKLVILANFVMRRRISLADVQTTGISKTTPNRSQKAREAGLSLKLIGRIDQSKATVGPEEISINDPVCVPDTLNALTFSTEHSGDMTLMGQGAGGVQTATAILRDLVDIRSAYSVQGV